MIINQYYNFYTNEVSKKVADELIARIDALSAVNRNVSSFGSSKQFFSVKNRQDAKPELLRKFQEWQNKRIAFAEVVAFRKVSKCCKGTVAKELEQAPFTVTIDYDKENGTVPGTNNKTSGTQESYGNIKYSVSDGLNKPSTYNKKPQAFLQSVTISNEGYAGIVQRIAIKMRVFTREAFEIIDKWYLRPGNEMLIKYGWSVPLTSMETATDTIHAVIFNFNATLTDDMGWLITVHGIAKGNLAVGIALPDYAEIKAAVSSGQETNTEAQFLVPNLTTILKNEVNGIRVNFPGVYQSDVSNLYDSTIDLDADNRPYGIIYDSIVFPHGIGRLKFKVEDTPPEYGLVPGQGDTAARDAQIKEQKYLLEKLNSRLPPDQNEFNNWFETLKQNPSFKTIYEKFKTEPYPEAQSLLEFYGQLSDFGIVNLQDVQSGKTETIERGGINTTTGDFNPSVTLEVDAKVWPPVEDFEKTDFFVIGKPDGTEDVYSDTQGSEAKLAKVQYRPPKGSIRRKVLDMIIEEAIRRKYIKGPSEEILTQRKQFDEAARTQQAVIEQQIAALEEENSALPLTVGQTSRITEADSMARYYICLGDLVYYFNEHVFKQSPELYNSVQLLVENQPTSYDPNLVSSIPMDVILSNAKNNVGGMSSYGLYNSINHGFKYKKSKDTGDLQPAVGCDGVDFYPHDEFNSFDDMNKHREDWGIYLKENAGEKIAAFNIAHIWISVDVVSQAYMEVLLSRAIDPQYRTVFDFFEFLFSRIAQATAGAVQLTLIPDNNQLYSNKTVDSFSLSLQNPLLKKTQLFRIVDNNFQVPHNLPGAPRSFDFKVNDVNATILRDVNMSLKLPSKLQTVAYTYGRTGINDEITDIDDTDGSGNGLCKKDIQRIKTNQEEILKTLQVIKDKVAYNLSAENLDRLVAAIGQYVANPSATTSNATDTTLTVASHPAWIYSKLYPVELQFKIDGIAGFLYGNKVNVINALPSRYSERIFFTLTKIEHEISNNDWVTTLTAIARLKNSNGLVQFPKEITEEGSPDLCAKVKEVSPLAVTVYPDSNLDGFINSEIQYSGTQIVDGAITYRNTQVSGLINQANVTGNTSLAPVQGNTAIRPDLNINNQGAVTTKTIETFNNTTNIQTQEGGLTTDRITPP